MRSVFVSGTDTGVGKTVVAAALARTAAMAGCRTATYKPFMSGGAGDVVVMGTAMVGSGGGGSGGDVGVVPSRFKYAFKTPASPYTAARLEGVDIDIGAVLERFERMQRDSDAVVVEGIGGVMTPILRDYFVADLARDMMLPVVIVTSNGLDSVGHSAMAAHHCRRRGAHVAGFVVNYTEEDGYGRGVMSKEIGAVAGGRILASVERHRESAMPGGEQLDLRLAALDPGIPSLGPEADIAASIYAAAGASERGEVDGAARIIFGPGRAGGRAGARWRRQARKRREMRDREAGYKGRMPGGRTGRDIPGRGPSGAGLRDSGFSSPGRE